MRHFLQAAREGGRHWPALLVAFCCSFGVAFLWSANIAALFPLIKTTLSGQSVAEWNEQQLVDSRRALVEHEQKLAELNEQIETAEGDRRARLLTQADATRTKIGVEHQAIEWAEWTLKTVAPWLPSQPFQVVVIVIIAVLLGTTLRLLLLLANALIVAWVSQTIVRDVRNRVFSKAIELDTQSFESFGVSGVQALITHTADMLAYGLTSFFSGAVNEPLRIAACLFGAACISWRLTLASVLLAPIAGYLMVGLNKRVRSLSLRILDRSLGFHHITIDVLGSHHSVQANTMETFEQNRFHDATGQMRKVALKGKFYEALASPLTEFLGMGILCTGLLMSAYLVLNQQTTIFGIPMTAVPLDVTSVTVFLSFLIAASDPLRKLSRVVSGINNGMAAANILYGFFDNKPTIRDPQKTPAEVTPFESLEFCNVRFTYDGINDVLQGVNLKVNKGDRLGVIGVNGSGKSTLMNLVCRFYDPHGGQVRVNGRSLREYRVEDHRSRFAVVWQKSELFNETIMHNIRYGRWDATDAEVIEAAKLARAHEFISETPDGYETTVGMNGHRLSGGQRQRVALARAFLRNAEVLILDEATSQIDVESERLIHEALAEYGRGRTIIFITHRESTLSLATRIVRMEAGEAVEIDSDSLAAA